MPAPIPPDLLQALQDADFKVRAAAAKKLGETRNPAAVDHLIRMSHDPTVTVRAKVAQQLKKFKDPKAIPALVMLAADVHGVHRFAYPHVIKLGQQAVPGVIDLVTHPEARYREASIQLLQVLDRPALKPLLPVLLNDTNDRVRFAALTVTTPHDLTPEVIDALRKLAVDSYHSAFRRVIHKLLDPLLDMLPLTQRDNELTQRVVDYIETTHKKRQKTLDLSSFGISLLVTLPPEIGKLTQLRELNLGMNKLRTLPPEIGQLHNLRELYVSSNRLTTLPPEIGQLRNLQKLDLSINQLTELPHEIGDLQSLKELLVSLNRLKTLPPDIMMLRRTRGLHIVQ